MLIVFGGRPGSGKSSVAKELSRNLSAVYLRVDEVEQAIKRSEGLRGDVGVTGYEVVQRLALSNLQLGLTVVVDCVNPVLESRDAFHRVARESGCRVLDVEIVCSDAMEHRRRVESRGADIPGHVLPNWEGVWMMEYEPWMTDRLVLDMAVRSCDDGVGDILKDVASAGNAL